MFSFLMLTVFKISLKSSFYLEMTDFWPISLNFLLLGETKYKKHKSITKINCHHPRAAEREEKDRKSTRKTKQRISSGC